MRKTLLLALAALVLLCAACSSRPKGVLSKGKMRSVLHDYHLAQAMMEAAGDEQRDDANRYLADVFEKHNITQEQFDTSMVWYNQHCDQLQSIYEDLRKQFSAENERIQLATGSSEMTVIYTADGDTANIWQGPSVVILRPRDILSLHTLTISADTSFRASDKFRLLADVNFICADNSARDNHLTATLTMHNIHEKTFSETRQVMTPSHIDLNIGQANPDTIDDVNAFFYFQPGHDDRNICVISNILLLRMHVAPDTTAHAAAEADSAQAETPAAAAPRKRKPELRLSPDDLREQTTKDNEAPKIKTAPDVRTPNSIGPSRRRNNKTQKVKRAR